jgi:hypothetical protein
MKQNKSNNAKRNKQQTSPKAKRKQQNAGKE